MDTPITTTAPGSDKPCNCTGFNYGNIMSALMIMLFIALIIWIITKIFA